MSELTTTAPTRMLADGHAMPVLGLGTWPLDDDGARAVVGDALRAGYRLVDTATNYGNERGVGRGTEIAGADPFRIALGRRPGLGPGRRIGARPR